MTARLAEVTTLFETNARDIPSMLRQAADGIETEAQEGFSPPVAIVAVQISASGHTKIYGWGDTNDMHSIALLERGKHALLDTLRQGED
jgi:hypothetical protein